MTPQEGFEPTTNRLTADRSTAELLRKWSFRQYIKLSRNSQYLVVYCFIDGFRLYWVIIGGRGGIGRHARFRF